MVIKGRTDMAAEACRLWRRDEKELDGLPGVRAWEERDGALGVSAVEILDGAGAERLGKPPGRYYTLELPEIPPRGDEGFRPAVEALARLLRRCIGEGARSFLLAALGNAEVTPDALGPLSAGFVFPTRHLIERGEPAFRGFSAVSVCRPGVLGTSGVESAGQVGALCRLLKPDCVLAVDALAGADADRLCRTVQVSDAGVAPGSGVGNDRAALTRETLGVPVVAIGVPTVIDAAYFAQNERFRGLYVTPRGIGTTLHSAARLIGCAIDLAAHPGLELEDVFALID